MKKLHPKRDGVLRILHCPQPNGQQLSLLATDKRVLCYQNGPASPWEPIARENLGLAAAINRL